MAEHRADVPDDFNDDVSRETIVVAPADQTKTVVVRSTQEAEPGRAVLRTLISLLPAIISGVLLLPELVQIVVESYGETLPPSFRGVLLAVSGFIVTTTLVMTRIMASVKVNEWLRKNFKPAAPDNKPPLNGPVA